MYTDTYIRIHGHTHTHTQHTHRQTDTRTDRQTHAQTDTLPGNDNERPVDIPSAFHSMPPSCQMLHTA